MYQPDHYRLLAAPFDASQSQLKDAYRRLSKLYHPDRHDGSRASTERFQAIAAAYRELSDPRKRAAYDRLLVVKDPLRVMEGAQGNRALDTLDDVVRRWQRTRRALPRRARGRDLRVRAEIPFEIAALGGLMRVTVSYRTSCRECDATGSATPNNDLQCHVCGGGGQLLIGVRRRAEACGFCEGKGNVLLRPCTTCDGKATVQEDRDVDLHVPARTLRTTSLRVRGAGETSDTGGPAGDVIVDATVQPHDLLRVEGDDLCCSLPVTPSEALIGSRRQVPSLSGPKKLKIPAMSRGGQELRIAGQGLPRPRGGRGDLRFKLVIALPDGATRDGFLQLQRLEQELGMNAFTSRQRFEDALHTVET